MDVDDLIKLRDDNVPIWKIAEKYNKSYSTIRYYLNKYKIYKTSIFLCKFCGTDDASQAMNKGAGRKSKSKCIKCHAIYTIQRFNKFKTEATEYKGGKCIRCGYGKCSAALHFHHRDPKQKDPDWKKMKNRTFSNIKDELDKCDLVCANCHSEIHWELNLMPE